MRAHKEHRRSCSLNRAKASTELRRAAAAEACSSSASLFAARSVLCHEMLCSYLLHSKHSPFRFPAFQAFTPGADDLRVGQLLVGAAALHATELLQRVPATCLQQQPQVGPALCRDQCFQMHV